MPPIAIEGINALKLIDEIKEFYSVTNGLYYNYFEILPLMGYKNIKKIGIAFKELMI